MRAILSTRNKGKIAEINRLLEGSGVVFSGLDEFPGVPGTVEDGTTFHENALKKARTAFEHTGLTALSEDSGLEVDALDGAPGIHSARYASENATDRENIDRLLRELRGVPAGRRTARFICVFCLYDGTLPRYFEGLVRGRIIDEARGQSGFGYDPVFVPDGYDRTFAELGTELKNSISHRADALRKLRRSLAGVP